MYDPSMLAKIVRRNNSKKTIREFEPSKVDVKT